MNSTQAILIKYGQAIVAMLKSKVQPLSATGKTVESIHEVVKPNRLTVYGRKYFETIETGRGPRKSIQYGGFDKGLDEYLRARGLPTKTSKSGKVYYKIGESWTTAKSLAHKINKEGDRTYKKGGRMVYSDELERLVTAMSKEVIANETKEFVISLRNSFKDGAISS